MGACAHGGYVFTSNVDGQFQKARHRHQHSDAHIGSRMHMHAHNTPIVHKNLILLSNAVVFQAGIDRVVECHGSIHHVQVPRASERGVMWEPMACTARPMSAHSAHSTDGIGSATTDAAPFSRPTTCGSPSTPTSRCDSPAHAIPPPTTTTTSTQLPPLPPSVIPSTTSQADTATVPRCPACKSVARPNILMFNDFG